MLDIYSGFKMGCRQSNTKRDAKSSFSWMSIFRKETPVKQIENIEAKTPSNIEIQRYITVLHNNSIKAKEIRATTIANGSLVPRPFSTVLKEVSVVKERTRQPQHTQKIKPKKQFVVPHRGQPINLLPNITATENSLRYIIIDGSNVAMGHGKHKAFSSRGIKFAVDHFVKLGHTNVVAMVPQYRRRALNHKYPTLEHELLDEMENNQNLVYTTDKAYDDRFIIKAAVHHNALIVSNDKYRDLMQENKEWGDLIKKNRIGFAFVGDFFQIPDDPMGRKGPKLQELLSNSSKCHSNVNTSKVGVTKKPTRANKNNVNINSSTNTKVKVYQKRNKSATK